jgi:hypothetical protein
MDANIAGLGLQSGSGDQKGARQAANDGYQALKPAGAQESAGYRALKPIETSGMKNPGCHK